ncbi:natterin-3-like [Clinocottus analis]|uniref:natterin-3-like n=1 Tax=Clinocottus analis TaxID=304258 RepID=UPI0035BECCC7
MAQDDQTHLEWKTFDGSLPNGAVSIYNDYAKRTDYVCKHGRAAGFYNPDMGPYCHYAYGDKEHLSASFEILVNKDDFEFLEWKGGSYGSVPPNSVETCPNTEIYVGKNQYGLGKVDVKNEAFFLPWEGSEYWYKSFEVLTINKEICSEHIYDVKYNTDGIKPFKSPPETMNQTTLVNKSCQTVKQKASLSKTYQEEQRWDISYSITVGVKTSITAGIPIIGSANVELGIETTLQFSKGTTYTESKEYAVSVEHDTPPNHSCSITMVGYKYEADIPFTARVKRTYSNGKTTVMSIVGTYTGVQIGEVLAVVDRCEPLAQ